MENIRLSNGKTELFLPKEILSFVSKDKNNNVIFGLKLSSDTKMIFTVFDNNKLGINIKGKMISMKAEAYIKTLMLMSFLTILLI